MEFSEGYAYRWTGGIINRNSVKLTSSYMHAQIDDTSESDSSTIVSISSQTHSRLSNSQSSQACQSKRTRNQGEGIHLLKTKKEHVLMCHLDWGIKVL